MEAFIKYINIPVNKLLFDKYFELGIDEKELVVLLKLIEKENNNNRIMDFQSISSETSMNAYEITQAVSHLIQNGLLEMKTRKEQGKYEEIFSTEILYPRLIALMNINNNKDENSIASVFQYIEELYGRALSPFEFEMIKEWIETDQHDIDEVKHAVDLANANQIQSLKYVGRILHHSSSKTTENIDLPYKNWLSSDDL